MKIQGWMFLACAVFFAAADVVYWFWSAAESPTGKGDPTGTTALGISVGLAFMIGYYLLFTARRLGEQPEDDPEGDIADKAGEVGFFSPYSWWPLWVAASAALVVLGLVFATWIALLGAALILMTTIGFVFEYYRGNFSH